MLYIPEFTQRKGMKKNIYDMVFLFGFILKGDAKLIIVYTFYKEIFSENTHHYY